MKKIQFIYGTILLMLLAACNKEISDNNFTAYNGDPLNDTVWVKNISSNAPIYEMSDSIFHRMVFADSLDITKDQTIDFGDSLEIEIKANSFNFTPNGSQGGRSRIEILRLRKKGEFIAACKPNGSLGYPLETAGGFFIRFTNGGNELMLAQGASIKIRYSDLVDPVNNMQLFYGRETSPFPAGALDSAHTWIRDADTSWIKTFVKQTGGLNTYRKGYEIEAKKLRWISAHRYLDSTLAKTNIYAILPPNFTNRNTQVFAVMVNNRTVLGMRSDFGSRSFTTGNIPLKSKIMLVSLSKIGRDFYLGTKLVNDVGTVINYSFTPEKKTLSQIGEFLDSL